MNFLPGWFPAAMMSGGITNIAFFNSATANNTSTITCPASIQAGDLIVLVDVSTSGSGILPTQVTPTNFTAIHNLSLGTDSRMVTSYKIAAGTEGGTNVTGMAAGSLGRTAKAMLVFRPNKPAVLATVASSNSQTTTGNPNAQTVSSASGIPPLIVLGFYGATADINPRTFTVGGSSAKDGEAGVFSDGPTADACAYAAYKIYNTSPADVVIDMDDEGSNLLSTGYITLA